MANNLFVSYDLYEPGKDYGAVGSAIKELGSWAKVQKSLWYVRSSFTAEQAAEHVRRSMDRNDSLIVVDAASNDAYWFNLSPEVAQFLQERWRAQAA
ncbi:hypothetical protein [Bradyrhizobium zhanjiangense]|uniref:CRISPR-associated protein Cas2 n=1 Tax=Bradyrhizobium zhanjiangense TaxID=1325107 RepID=A0A4Q0SP94_9BRAD|nr:hypothetical protein [Bradyrhizobium zhanjiangense]RXH41172.1 hypothetical protein XH94_09225 [Bradyrhizobium zhanjiangense]